jgi:hypothetical protein
MFTISGATDRFHTLDGAIEKWNHSPSSIVFWLMDFGAPGPVIGSVVAEGRFVYLFFLLPAERPPFGLRYLPGQIAFIPLVKIGDGFLGMVFLFVFPRAVAWIQFATSLLDQVERVDDRGDNERDRKKTYESADLVGELDEKSIPIQTTCRLLGESRARWLYLDDLCIMNI